jgi:tetratricopeptide (TPR) repeat protein
MKNTLTLLLLSACLRGYADLRYIHLDKVDPTGQYNKEISFLTDNVQYYDHWTPDWNYPVKKDSLTRELTRCYTIFAQLQAKSDNVEIDLLVGEIAHFLYNLSVEEYYEKANAYYQKAIQLDEKDYRGYWFLANHYTYADVQDKSVIFFKHAQRLLPSGAPADFWAEYAYGMLLANMSSHCRMALDTAKKISGGSDYIDQLDKLLKLRCMSIDADSVYQRRDLWTGVFAGRQIQLLSRALGLKLRIDSSWGLQFTEYNKHQTALIMTPPMAKNNKGKKIGFTIGLIMKVAGQDETLDAFLSQFAFGGGGRTQDSLPSAWKNIRSYSLRNKEVYPDWGGGHFHIIGIERSEPAYPGLLLEEPQKIPDGTSGKVNFYMPVAQRTRFPGRIFYMFMLDTCEDIHDASYAVFSKLIQDQLVIE